MQQSQKPNAWMYVDETASSDGIYIGASAVLLTSQGGKSLRACTETFRASFADRGIPAGIEIHAGVWVQEKHHFPGMTAFHRISALGDYLRLASKCNGVQVINILIDTSHPELLGARFRERIWETLFWEFELFLVDNRLHGETVFDRDRVGLVIDVHQRMRKHTLKRQIRSPIPADSHAHDALQFADVCAYFMLQQVATNNQVKRASAANYINRIATLCPDPTASGQALIRDLI